jgi:broad specificity phosphatase PhoE
MVVIRSIIATHQYRIRCLLSEILKDRVGKFKNGSILRIILVNELIFLQLVHNGSGKKDEGYYSVAKNILLPQGLEKQQDAQAIRVAEKAIAVESGGEELIINGGYGVAVENKIIEKTDENIYIFYLIRHGQALHNIKQGLGKKIQSIMGVQDTSLTRPKGAAGGAAEGVEESKGPAGGVEESKGGEGDGGEAGRVEESKGGEGGEEETGSEQAVAAGGWFLDNQPKIDYFFASDLKRTQETLCYVLTQIPTNEKIYILPCSHELYYKPNKKCDGNQGFLPSAQENKTTWKPGSNLTCNDLIKPDTKKEKQEGEKEQIDGFFYQEFYGDQNKASRSNPDCDIKKRKRCRDTNMLNEAIKIIEKLKNPEEGKAAAAEGEGQMGGRKYKRSYRKRSNRKRTTIKKTSRKKSTRKNKKRNIKRETKMNKRKTHKNKKKKKM